MIIYRCKCGGEMYHPVNLDLMKRWKKKHGKHGYKRIELSKAEAKKQGYI